MDIRQLRYFIAIVEAGSFSRAAEKLHIAQPALSQHVMLMEAALGVSLLHRTTRGVLATEAGLRLFERALAIDAEFSTLDDHVRGVTAVMVGEVRVGMPGTISEQLGVPLIEAARQQYPNIRIRISEAMSGFVLDWLRDGSVDLALLYNVPDEKGLTLHHALTEEIVLFGIPGMESAPDEDNISLAAALLLPLILPGASHGLRYLIDAASKSIGKKADPSVEIDSYRQIKQLVVCGLGFGMLPPTAIKQELEQGIFRAWKISGPPLVRRIHLGYSAVKPLSIASKAVGQLSWTILESLVHNDSWAAKWGDTKKLGLHP
jgi:LysR family nitrogen assimilation transcriptional regulator